MQVIPVKCPNCGANVYLEEWKVRGFCSNCGSQILVDDGVQRTVNVSINQTKERELEIKELQFREAIERIEIHHKSLIKSLWWRLLILAVFIAMCVIGAVNKSLIELLTFGAPIGMLYGIYMIATLAELGTKNEKIEVARAEIFKDDKPLININFGKRNKKDS